MSSNVRKLVVQAKLRINMIERMNRDIDKAKKSLAVLERAVLTHKFAAMIVATEDPGYRSNLTMFTVDHAAVQTMTLLHYYEELIASLEMGIELTKGLWGVAKRCIPRQRAVKKAMDTGAISERTVYNWRHDYENNGYGFSGNLLGKAVST